jgi:hypothetical protein
VRALLITYVNGATEEIACTGYRVHDGILSTHTRSTYSSIEDPGPFIMLRNVRKYEEVR